MQLTTIQRAGSLLSVFAFIVLVSYIGSAVFPLFGSLYLILASSLATLAMLIASRLRKEQRNGGREPATWLHHTKAYVLLLAALQMTIVGLFNILGYEFSKSLASVVLGYVLLGVFTVVSYREIAIADLPAQEGGAKPLSFFGRPRSRRLVFSALLYSPVGPIILLSLVWFDWKGCPTLLRVPHVWLLVSAVLASISAGLVFQRYGKTGTKNECATQILVVAVVTLALTGAVAMLLGYNAYLFTLSSTTAIAIAVAVHYLSFARERAIAEVD